MNDMATFDTESEILEQVIEPDAAGMSPEAAQAKALIEQLKKG